MRGAHLGGAIEARLDVGVHGAVLEAGGAEVDDLDLARVEPLEQHVLRLEIAVDDVALMQHRQRIQDLQRAPLILRAVLLQNQSWMCTWHN